MKVSYSIFPLGDQAITLEFDGDTIDTRTNALLRAMKLSMDENPFDGMLDTILGYRSITVTFDLFRLSSSTTIENASQFVKQKLEESYHVALELSPHLNSRHIRIPVCYDRRFGLDIDNISSSKNVSHEDIIALHTSQSYHVYLVGFLPGFPYLGFVNPKLEMPRLTSPRANVPAGSVGIAGRQTGIYPFASPGGWQIVGCTPLKMFDPKKSLPVFAEIGDTVSFYPISLEEFEHIQNSFS